MPVTHYDEKRHIRAEESTHESSLCFMMTKDRTTTKDRAVAQQPASTLAPTELHASLWQEAILPYLLSRLALFAVGLLAAVVILPLLKSTPVLPSVENSRLPDAIWLIWNRFDAGFYVNIAQHGYWAASTLTRASNWIFLPLYPVLMYLLHYLFGGHTAAFDIAGIVISNLAGLMAVIYFDLLLRREFNSHIVTRAVLYLIFFPLNFYLSAIYPEALFLACALACIYYARRQRWWLAGVCGALASLTRIQGFLLIVPVAWEYWQVLSERYAPLPDLHALTFRQQAAVWLRSRFMALRLAARELRNWLYLLAVALIPLGLLPFLIYSQITVGDALATIHNHSSGWGRHFVWPWLVLLNAFRHPQALYGLNWNFWLLNVSAIVLFLGLTILWWRKLPMTYTLYALVMVVMPLATNSINSISRYYLTVFPVFILLAMWSNHEKQSARHTLILTLFAALQALFLVFYVLGLPLIA